MKFLLFLLLPVSAQAWTVQGDLNVTNNLSVSSFTTVGSTLTVEGTYITGPKQGASGTSQFLTIGSTVPATVPLAVEVSPNLQFTVQPGFDANSNPQVFLINNKDGGNAAATSLSLTNSSNAGVVIGGPGPAAQTLDVRGGLQTYGPTTLSGATGVNGALSIPGLTGAPSGSTAGGGYICWGPGVGHLYYKTTTCP